jgi:hypothetical protein
MRRARECAMKAARRAVHTSDMASSGGSATIGR